MRKENRKFNVVINESCYILSHWTHGVLFLTYLRNKGCRN